MVIYSKIREGSRTGLAPPCSLSVATLNTWTPTWEEGGRDVGRSGAGRRTCVL